MEEERERGRDKEKEKIRNAEIKKERMQNKI